MRMLMNNLDPEVADTMTFGVVLTPQGLPGFTATVEEGDPVRKTV